MAAKQLCAELLGKMVTLFGLLMLQAIPTFGQDQDDISEKLKLKYEDVVSSYQCDTLFCVKKNDSWEFADADGKLLSTMHISDVSCPLSNYIFTLNGIKYTLCSYANGKFMVERYDRYAYMDKKGTLITPFIYDSAGEKTFDASESKEALRVNEAVEKYYDEYKYSSDPPVNNLLDIVTPANAHLLTDNYSDNLAEDLAKYSIKKPDKTDKTKLNALFKAMFDREDCNYSLARTIATYWNMTADSDEEKFSIVERMAKKYYSSEINYTYGYMLQNGMGCEKNIQEAIFNYEACIEDNDARSYVDLSEKALRALWLEDSTSYKNPYGRLLNHYDSYRHYYDYVFVRKNELVGVCDSTLTEMVPCRFKDFYNLMPPLFVVKNIDDERIIVKTGGEPLTSDSYDDVELLKDKSGAIIAIVQKDGKWGFVDDGGRAVTPMVFDEIHVPFLSLPYNYPTITVGGMEYELVTLFCNNRAIVTHDGLYGIMGNDGKIVVPCSYTSIEEFDEGRTNTRATKGFSTTVNLDLVTGKESPAD